MKERRGRIPLVCACLVKPTGPVRLEPSVHFESSRVKMEPRERLTIVAMCGLFTSKDQMCLD